MRKGHEKHLEFNAHLRIFQTVWHLWELKETSEKFSSGAFKLSPGDNTSERIDKMRTYGGLLTSPGKRKQVRLCSKGPTTGSNNEESISICVAWRDRQSYSFVGLRWSALANPNMNALGGGRRRGVQKYSRLEPCTCLQWGPRHHHRYRLLEVALRPSFCDRPSGWSWDPMASRRLVSCDEGCVVHKRREGQNQQQPWLSEWKRPEGEQHPELWKGCQWLWHIGRRVWQLK